MRRLSDIISHLSYSIALLAAVLLSACAGNDTTETEDPLPDGMGRLKVTVTTRAVYEDPANTPIHEFPWETPDHEWEVMHSLRVIICKASDNTVVQIINVTEQMLHGDTPPSLPSSTPGNTGEEDYIFKYNSDDEGYEVISDALPVGKYYIYATANYDDGYQVGNVVDLDRTERFPFGLSKESDYTTAQYEALSNDQKDAIPFGVWRNIPMTGALFKKATGEADDGTDINVSSGTTTNVGTLTVWRVISKMQFEFANESAEPIEIYGIEVEPINLASENGPGIYLFSKDDLTLTDNLEAGEYGVSLPPKGINPKSAREDVGRVRYEVPENSTSPLLTIPANSAAYDANNKPLHSIYFYLNETDATYTTTQNQLSLRFRIKRGSGNNKIEEIRYGVTTHHDLSDNDPYGGYSGGFNVIRRNDWIHIPVVLTDWQFRIEPLAFVPIAGYPAKTLSSDGLTATFSTGGMIALQPFIKKYSDKTWRGFGDPEITYGNDSWAASIHWKNKDGDDESGATKIVKTAFAYDPVTKCIIGELNNAAARDLDAGSGNHMTTFTVCLKLGPANDPSKQYIYTFTFNVVLEK